MNIVVCVKRVPMTQDVDLEIDSSKKNIDKDMLAYVLNEWDHYAIEEAIQIKENLDGEVTVVTIGNEDDEEVLRRGLAMGADKALRIDPGELELDGFAISRILAEAIRNMEYDLIFTGVQADDHNEGMVGAMLAEHLGIAHSTVVTNVQIQSDETTIRGEREGGIDEISKIQLPAHLSIQTGINEPRYVSMMGVRKASKKPLDVQTLEDLGISEDQVAPQMIIEEYYLPPETEGAEIIEGDAGTVAEKILRIIKEKGVNV